MPWRLILTDVPSNPKSWLHQLKYWSRLRKLAVVYQGDLIAYIKSPGDNKYARIHDIITATIAECMSETMATEATGQNPAPVTIVGHSLGSVIASDALYDARRNGNCWWPAQLRLANFFSLGCPLSLYTLRYKMDTEKCFQKAIRMQNPNGLWINIFDPQDIVGYPLKPLNTAYCEAVFLDKEISLGHWWNPWHLLLRWTPLNHYMYWEDYSVAYIIGKKAALDWMQTNRPDLAPQLNFEYAAYQDELRTNRSKYS
ncbi:MAG: hypothetical protein P0111_10960 [Nitrospira sp.]|nr:hypothetical protein [Nitrospira sp.]